MITLVQHPKAAGQTFNIGHSQDISILELAELVKAKTESRSDIVLVPYEEAFEAGFEDMARRLPDISKIHSLIGYEPTLQLPEMLDRIIEHARQRAQVSLSP